MLGKGVERVSALFFYYNTRMADYSAIRFEDGTVEVSTGLNSSRLTGSAALIQEVLIELLSDNIPARARGAGLASLIKYSDPTREGVVATEIANAVSTAQTHIFANQRDARGLTSTERLRSLTLTSLDFDGIEWRLGLTIESLDGTISTITQGLVSG